MSYVTSAWPFESSLLNYINFINELFVLLSSYFLLLFTNSLVPNVQLREKLGWVFLYSIIAVIGLNFVILFAAIGLVIVKKVSKRRNPEKF